MLNETHPVRSLTFTLAAVVAWFAWVPPAQAEWWLWESPHDNTESLDQSQPEFDSVRQMQSGHGIGQSFVPDNASLYRLDLMIKNRYDLRPFTIKLWQWADLNTNGLTEDSEYDATVAGPLLWQDTLAVPGSEDRELVTLFPRLNVATGLPYYFELSNSTGDGEWGVFVVQSEIDPYPSGSARLQGIFRHVPNGPDYVDLYFRTYAAPSGLAPPLNCEPAGVSPCLSTSEPWELPDAPGPGLTREDLRSLVESKADSDRSAILSGGGGAAHTHTMLDAFLYRVTGDELYAQHALDLFDKATERRAADPAAGISFTWLEHPGWAYKWIQDSPTLNVADRQSIKTLLLHSGMKIWPGREMGAWNHAFARALGYKLVTDLIPAEEFAALSACLPGPAPACDGLFQEGESLSAADHAAWQAYALGIWQEFTTHWDFLEDSSRYQYLDFQLILQLILVYDAEEFVWNEPGFRALVDRTAEYVLPMGVYPVFGDMRGLDMAWLTPIWLFEQAAVRWQEPRYKWLADRIYDFRRSRLKDHVLSGAPIDFWNAVYEEYPSACHGYFDLDPQQPAAPPPPLTESIVVEQSLDDSEEWSTTAGGIGQTFTALETPLVRVDVRLRSGGSPEPTLAQIWKWSGSYSSTVAAEPLFAELLPIAHASTAAEVSLLPFVQLEPGETYFIEFRRETAFPLLGSPPLAPDIYPGGELWESGQPRGNADLWFRTYSLTGMGSTVTSRRESSSLRLSQRGYPPWFQQFGPSQVLDKLILRSGHGEDDLHAVVNLATGPLNHGQLEAGAVTSLANDGSVILVGGTYEDRREKDQNTFLSRRHWGGAHTGLATPLELSKFSDHRGATVAWLDWQDPSGWSVNHQRRLFFVKNRFLLIRDRARFDAAMTATSGSIWHSYDVHPDHGSHWFSLYNREPVGLYGWLFRNPEQYALLYMLDRPGIEVQEWQVAQTGNPPSSSFNIAQRWVGDAAAGSTRWFDSLLLPHGGGRSPTEVAGDIEVLYDDGVAVVWKIAVGDEFWTVVDNPEDSTIATPSLTTNARYLVARTSPGGSGYVLTHLASHLAVDDGIGRRIDLEWPIRTSSEIDETALVQDTDSDGTSDFWDEDDDGDGVADGTDGDPLDPFRCRDLDGDSCDDCASGVDNPAEDGPDADDDGVCDAGDNCLTRANPNQADLDSDGIGDLCDVCQSIFDPAQSDQDLDRVGDACDNCGIVFNSSQSDLDDDGTGDHCDVNDGTIYVLISEQDRVEWQDESGFTDWNLYRGGLAVLRATSVYSQELGSSDLAERWCGLQSPWTLDFFPVSAGEAAFYLATGTHGGGENGLGSDGGGSPRPNDSPCP